MLYLIKSGEYIKVGLSKDVVSFKKRMKSYKTANPNILLMGICEGTEEDERNYHRKLDAYKLYNRAEWFKQEALPLIIDDFKSGEMVDNINIYFNQRTTNKSEFNYKDLYKDYLATKDKSYLDKYPEFKDYELFLKDTEMNSLFFNKEKMMRLVKDKQKFIYEVIPAISKKFGRDFASSKDLKDFMKIKFEELGIIQLKPKASLLEDFGAIKTSKMLEKKTKGYILNDLTTITFKF